MSGLVRGVIKIFPDFNFFPKVTAFTHHSVLSQSKYFSCAFIHSDQFSCLCWKHLQNSYVLISASLAYHSLSFVIMSSNHLSFGAILSFGKGGKS